MPAIYILPGLKDGDSHRWTLMPERKNVSSRVNIAIVSDTHSQQVHSFIRNPLTPCGPTKEPQAEQTRVVYASRQKEFSVVSARTLNLNSLSSMAGLTMCICCALSVEGSALATRE